jgi:hypothetical protein
MGRIGGTLLCVALASGATTCGGSGGGPEALHLAAIGAAACDLLARCGCVPVDALTVCPSEVTAVLGWSVDGEEREPGVVFDEQCARDMEAWFRRASCGDDVTTMPVCRLTHGTTPEGLFCEEEEECGRGLSCLGNECRDPAQVAPLTVGSQCDDEGLSCAAGSQCIEERCQMLPAAGQPCLDGDCAFGNTCDGIEGICVALGQEGEPCTGHAQCVSYNCPRGFCAPIGQTGSECEADIQCAPGLRCVDALCQGQAGPTGGVCNIVAGYFDLEEQ